jgi:hypothetical protein
MWRSNVDDYFLEVGDEVVEAIIESLKKLKGLGQAWNELDLSSQEDIKSLWLDIASDIVYDRLG